MMDQINPKEQRSMTLIARSGEERSLAFQALECAKKGDFDQADQQMRQSAEAGTLAQKSQTEFLSQSEAEEIDMLMVHAENHLMTSMLAAELIGEMIILYRKLDEPSKGEV